MKKLLFFCFIYIPFFCFSKEEFIISSIPDESINELHKKFKPLVKYLKNETNLKIKFIPVSDYAAVVEALVTKKIDMAWLGGFTFIQANIRSSDNVIPIIQRYKDQEFRSVFITNKDSGINSFKDLKDKTISFGSPSSTSGHLMPRHFLIKNNIVPEKVFTKIAYSGSHDATIFSVLGKKVDVGTLNSLVWKKIVNKRDDVRKNLKVFYTTDKYFDYNWTLRSDILDSTRIKITDAFLKLDYNNKDHRKILDLQRAKKYIRTKKLNYNTIKKAGIEANLIKDSKYIKY